MRILLVLWAVPLVFFWSWYALSANDISFGTIFLSRQLHDVVFDLYGRTLGVPADAVPSMMAWACAFDSCLILAMAAFRWRANWLPGAKVLITRWSENARAAMGRGREQILSPVATADPALPAE